MPVSSGTVSGRTCTSGATETLRNPVPPSPGGLDRLDAEFLNHVTGQGRPRVCAAFLAARFTRGEGIPAERVGDLRDRALGPHAVAGVVQRRRDDGNAEL